MIYIITFLLLILVLSNDAARGLLKSIIHRLIRIGVMLLLVGMAIFVVYLAWGYITHYMPGISQSRNSEIQWHANLLKNAKNNWVVYPVAAVLIVAFLVLIYYIGILINKWIEKVDKIKFWKH
jgi:multisubunit Na+/H+ antiporter MnhC subunit